MCGSHNKECMSSSVSVFVWRMQSVPVGLGRFVSTPYFFVSLCVSVCVNIVVRVVL